MCNLQYCLGDFARLLKVHFTSSEGMSNDTPHKWVWKWDKALQQPLRALLFTKSECVGSLTSHRFNTCARACETGPTVYRLYQRIKTRMFNCLRCHFKAALSPRTRPGFNQRPSVQLWPALIHLTEQTWAASIIILLCFKTRTFLCVFALSRR